MPVIHDHHHHEEVEFFKAYIDKGSPTPDHQIADHKSLVQGMEDIRMISEKLYNLAVKEPNSADIAPTQEQLKTSFTAWNDLMCAHLAEEETFWPPELLKQGNKFHDQVIQTIVNAGVAAKGVEGEAFKMLFCSIADALGAPPKAAAKIQKLYGPFKLEIDPWAGKQNHDAMYYGVPFPVRWLLRPMWDRRYQTWKATIESVWGNEDVMKIAV